MKYLEIEQRTSLTHAKPAAAGGKARWAGYTVIGGCVAMIVGAALWGTSGTDLWLALDTGQMAEYLVAVEQVRGQLVANLTIWILGVMTIGVGAAQMADLCQKRPVLGRLALSIYRIAIPIVVVSYIAMLALVVQLGGDGSPTAVAIGEVVGWIGARADDLATALVLGVGPLVFTLAARGEWLSSKVEKLGYVCGMLAVVTIGSTFSASFTTFGFIIIPVGMLWLIWAGLLLIGQAKGRDLGG